MTVANLWEQGVDMKVKNNKCIGCKHGYKYGIAFSTYFHDMVIKKMSQYVMRRLCLWVFFVDKNGNVEEIDWTKMKKLQNNFQV